MANDKSKEDVALIKARIAIIAPQVSNQSLGLAYHRPEPWAKPSRCFQNVAQKVARDGGRIQFGWTFHLRFVEKIPGQGYLFLTHHAVWHVPDGRLINVTPYPEPKHYPLPEPGADILFLVDDKAVPFTKGKLIAPLPMRFFPIGDDARLVDYVEKLNLEEQEACKAIYGQ